MTEFEKAANEIDNDLYTGEMTQENCIEWIRGSKTATVTFPYGRYATKIRKLAEQYPDEVEIKYENKDGSIVAHVPVKYVSIRHPKKVNFTDEQLDAMRERAKQMFHKSNNADS